MANITEDDYVKLNDRILFKDGDSVVDIDFLYDEILKCKKIYNMHLSKELYESEEVQKYNENFPKHSIGFKKDIKDIRTEWVIPEKYKELDVVEYVNKCMLSEIKRYSLKGKDLEVRFFRMKMELRVWTERGQLDMLRTMIYVVETFRDKNIVWGTGRGSACASYILYLIGLHQVDSVKYELDIGEFFR